MTDDEPSDLGTYASRDEAIAVALANTEPGDEICIHTPECADDDEGEGCTCEPEILTRPLHTPEA